MQRPNSQGWLHGVARRACETATLAWAALAIGAAIALPAQASPQLLRIETIRAQPFGYENALGSGGMLYEMGNLIANKAGLPSRNTVVPFARTAVSLREGSADMVLRTSNEELAVTAIQLAPVLTLPAVVLSKANAPYKDLADLEGATVTVPRGFPLDARLSAIKGIKFQLVDSSERAVQMLLAGRVNAIYGSNLGLYGAARRQQVRLREFSKPIMLESQVFWLHVSRKTATPPLLQALKNGVTAAQRDGSLDEIVKHYAALLKDEPDSQP